MMLKAVVALLFLASISPAAEIEKKAVLLNDKIKLYWWPKLSIPRGWLHDEELSENMSSNVLLPRGTTFSNAPSIIYGRAFYDPDKKTRGTLSGFISDDVVKFRKSRAQLVVQEIHPGLTTLRHHSLRTFDFSYGPGTYDETCYGQEGDFWLIISLSSQTKRAFKRDKATFRRVIAAYK